MTTKPIRTIDYRLGEALSLATLRDIVDQTRGVDGAAKVEFRVELGQRDAEYYHIVITEP